MHLKTIILAISLLIFFKTDAQNISVEKSIWGVQTGILGIWVHNEYRLSDKIALRSEIGFDGGFRINSNSDYNYYVLTPIITAEPRWYYNIKKRSKKGKNTKNNSANFVALSLTYHPDWFTISNSYDGYIPDQISIIPYWAIRRTLGSHFNYETGLGLGYQYTFYRSDGYYENFGEIGIQIQLRIGYTF